MIVEKDSRQETVPMDLTKLAEFTEGDIDLEKELFDLFFEQADRSFGELQRSCVDGDVNTWRKAAHLMKGSSANLGAQELYDIFKNAEKSFEGNQQVKEKLLIEMEEKFLELKQFVKIKL